jgi:hypothetical protein
MALGMSVVLTDFFLSFQTLTESSFHQVKKFCSNNKIKNSSTNLPIFLTLSAVVLRVAIIFLKADSEFFFEFFFRKRPTVNLNLLLSK